MALHAPSLPMFRLIETLDLSLLDAIFFDFDGVLVDSNEIKNDAFLKSLDELSIASDVRESFMSYHRTNLGMGRMHKFRFLFMNLLNLPEIKVDEEVKKLSNRYAELVKDAVVGAPEIPGATRFLERAASRKPCFLITGTPQNEAFEICDRRGIRAYFKEICGSPTNKEFHIERISNRYPLNLGRCLFIGDALGDYLAADRFGIQFISIPKRG